MYFHFETIERAGGVRGYCCLFVHSLPAHNVTDRACYAFVSASVTQLEPKANVVSMSRAIEVPGSGMGGTGSVREKRKSDDEGSVQGSGYTLY